WGLRRDQARSLSRRRRLPAFVISVGNLTTGGTGKTPFTLWLSSYLASRERSHAILSRGYGRAGTRTAPVPQGGEPDSQVPLFGDEPVLLSRNTAHAPVWVGRDRWASGREALLDSGPGILILDDGFQHLSLARDLDLVLLDAHRPFGNGFLLPLGPLREPIAHLARADAFILTRAQNQEKVARTQSRLRALFPGKPIFCCRHRLTGFSAGLGNRSLGLDCLAGKRVAAFAGLGNNAAFFQSLREHSIDVVEEIHFPDHHPYGRDDMETIFRLSSMKRAHVLVTTEKDWVRLPPPVQWSVLTARLRLDFGEEHEGLCRYLDERLSSSVLRP
ncbi:MAG: tetraacyldisaccharide 4'-kinase, partial [Syntrophobacteraceae bacterium]|nr:tetraacyldisaccharide 4'-kinase [Syntrophobacteraceae bacterium]